MVDSWVPSGKRCCLPPGWSSVPNFHTIFDSGPRRLQFWLMTQEAVTASPSWTMGVGRLMCPHSSRPRMEDNGPHVTPLPGRAGLEARPLILRALTPPNVEWGAVFGTVRGSWEGDRGSDVEVKVLQLAMQRQSDPDL